MVAYADERRSDGLQNPEQAVDPAQRPNTDRVVQEAIDRALAQAAQHSSRSPHSGPAVSVVTTARAGVGYGQVVDAAKQVIDTQLAELQASVPLSQDQAAALRDQYCAAIALAAHGIAEEEQRREEQRVAQEESAAGAGGQTAASLFKRGTPEADASPVTTRTDLRPNEVPPPETPLRRLGADLLTLANKREPTPAGFNSGGPMSPVSQPNEALSLSA
jgi:hypothetical protein